MGELRSQVEEAAAKIFGGWPGILASAVCKPSKNASPVHANLRGGAHLYKAL
jgi:hypothetical protein